MIKRQLLLLAMLLVTSITFAQEVEEVQRSLITKKTATWCSFCGGWGWELFEGLVSDNEDKAILIAAHYSGNLQNSVGAGIPGNFGGSGQPLFYLGRVNQLASSGNADSKRESIKNEVDAAFATAPIANTGLVAYLNGASIQVNTRTKFFQAAEGEFYLGVYIIENGVEANQSGHNPSFTAHHKILRAVAGSDAFGQEIATGSQAAGSQIDLTHDIAIDSEWKVDQLELAAILWRKEGNNYEFVNAYSIDEFSSPTGVQEQLLAEGSLELRPNISRENTQAYIDLKTEQTEVNLTLYDQNGRKLSSIFNGRLAKGTHRFEIARQAAGIYFLHLKTEEGILTKKVIFN